MIHRFLIYDRKFNCRLDRRYPVLKPNFPMNTINSSHVTENDNAENMAPSTAELSDSSSWKTLIIKHIHDSEEENFDSEQLHQLNLDDDRPQVIPPTPVVEHSQELILGLTHSLKNMLVKLAPRSHEPSTTPTPTSTSNTVDGYSFSFKTSKYRLTYFESFTGWKLVMITSDTVVSGNANTQESVLKAFYSQILLNYLVTYPLGTIQTDQKSTERHKVHVKDDFLQRAGFLAKMDEFLSGASV